MVGQTDNQCLAWRKFESENGCVARSRVSKQLPITKREKGAFAICFSETRQAKGRRRNERNNPPLPPVLNVEAAANDISEVHKSNFL